jgi:hypothetical protein
MAAEHELEALLRRVAPYALRELEQEISSAATRVVRASEARRRLSPGASRARVTTANAKHMRACEYHDRLQRLEHQLKDALRGNRD